MDHLHEVVDGMGMECFMHTHQIASTTACAGITVITTTAFTIENSFILPITGMITEMIDVVVMLVL